MKSPSVQRETQTPMADLLADAPLPGWRGVLLRMGRTRSVVLTTLVSVLLSVFVTIVMNISVGSMQQVAHDLVVATLVPLLVAPVASGFGMGLLAEVEAARRALRELAIRDGLTQLHNRSYFLARLRMETERARRDGTPLTLILLDIDRFKEVNDSFGHAVGDAVLRHVAELLLDGRGPRELAARFGGEEFVVLLPGIASAEGVAVADRIRLAVGALAGARAVGPARPQVTASIGVADLGPAPETADELLRRADRAMYDAKRSGRNRCVPASPADSAPSAHGAG